MDNVALFFLIFNLNGSSPSLDKLMIFGADYLLYITILLVFILGIRGGVKDKKALLLILLTWPIAVLMIKIIHLFSIEPRPFIQYNFSPLINQYSDASFPSRHATIMAIPAFAYIYYKSKWALLFILLMLWVGTARVFVGVHYPIDIVGGILIAIASLLVAVQIKNFLKIRFFS